MVGLDLRAFPAGPGTVSPSTGLFNARPMACSSSWAQIRISARSKRGSEMPGMAISSWPEKKPPSMASTFAPERGAFKGRSRSRRLRCAEMTLSPRPQRKRNGPMTIKVGDKLPSVTLTQATAEGPKPVTTDEFFAGKKVALFALPGAFTPTCSAKHLPGFKQLAGEIKAKGVDVDRLPVGQRRLRHARLGRGPGGGRRHRHAGRRRRGLHRRGGPRFDASRFGMGKRSQRYSMIVDDGVVKELNIEEGGEFRVSAADYLLAQL